MFKDPFESAADSVTAPSEFCFPITPDDSLDLPQATKALYIGAGGDVTVLPVRNDAPVTFRSVAAGMVLDVRARAVLATGTTAANIVGLA